ncbi:MAG: carboxypeptidase-like regulatory domain-containing protein [Planctomycetia bacterium]|nr:carboxypeptidase-like regulatory domain-containing protein [Planctomycetia bacterium]
MSRLSILLSVIFIIPFLFVSCGKPKPDGLPRLYPTRLTVTQDGVPLPGALITLKPNDSSLSFSCGGMTNENGVVEIQTHGQYAGVPEGKYKVIANKSETIKSGPWDEMPKDNESAALTWYHENQDKLKEEHFYVIDAKYRNPQTTDLEITVTSAGLETTVELGPAVHDQVDASDFR